MKKSFFIFLHVLWLQILANPSSSEVQSGNVSIQAKGDTLSVMQKSDHAIINWQDFSIQERETTKILQPSSHSSILNRVVGKNLSKIDGHLQANGTVYLINPNGVVIGPNGVVNANRFYATTLELMDDEYLSGKNMLLKGNSTCKIIHQGTIQTTGGEVYLIAKEVESYGSIDTNGHPIGIIGAMEILLVKKDNHQVAIRPQKEKVENLTKELNVYSYAMNLDDDKRILANEQTKAIVGGNLQAHDSAVHILAEEIKLDKSTIDVSGDKEKEVLIGGDFQGKNPEYLNAQYVYVSPDTTILASGKEIGDGGKVIIWADKETSYFGNIYAQGGSKAGDGGFVEVSGKKKLKDYKGHVFTISEHGKNGKLLLDPYNVTISTSATANGSFDDEDPNVFSPSDSGCILNNSDLTDALALSDVIVQTNNGAGSEQGNITVSGDISWGEQTTLSLSAENKVLINSGFTIGNTNEDGTNFDAIEITGAGGASANYMGLENQGTITSYYGNISLEGQGGDTDRNNYGIYNNGGTISSTGTGAASATITLAGTGGSGSSQNYGIFNHDATITSADGAISITGTGNGSQKNNVGIFNDNGTTISSTGTGANAASITLIGTGGTGSNYNDGIFHVENSTITTADGNISITGTGKGSGKNNNGIYNSDSTISSTGDSGSGGTITLIGTGSTTGTFNNFGIYSSNLTLSSVEGDITLTGTGNGSSKNNMGIFHSDGTTLSSTGTGPTAASITLTGTGGAGTNNNYGIFHINSTITTVDGDISITGTGHGTGKNNNGIYTTHSTISSTGDSGSGGTITLTGTGSSTGTFFNRGIYNSNTIFSSVEGDIALTGTGNGSGKSNYGMYNKSSTISSTGTGATAATITLEGSGGSGTDSNFGILNFLLTLSSVDGNVTLTGTGHGTGRNNYGIFNSLSTTISSTGTETDAATLTMTGTGANGSTCNIGIYNQSITITSIDGEINITGNGNGRGSCDYGIFNFDYTTISSTGTGLNAATITMYGYTGNGTSDYGIYNKASSITSVNGLIFQGGDEVKTEDD